MFVLDVSVAATWWFADEVTPATDAVLERVASEGAVVPAVFFAEAANVLVQAERQRRITRALADQVLAIVAGLPIEVESPSRTPTRALDLARVHRLTVYDALYLETAIRRGLALATLDRELRRAARSTGIDLI